MERLFVDFLGQLKPNSEYLRLFSAIVIDVWKQKQAQTTVLHNAALRHVKDLREHKQHLVEAFIYKREIDRAAYQEQLDRLNEDLALAEIGERDAALMNSMCRPP